jgi:hypothetical protein
MTSFALVCLLLGALGAPGSARTDAPPATPQAAGGQELYHVHFVKAAPGKLAELIDAYVAAPLEPPTAQPPVILRHVEGDDWQLLVIAPLGTEETLQVAAPSAAMQEFLTRTRPLRAQHTDTFAIGPAWADARKALLGDDAAQGAAAAVYVVTVVRALPGHRDQLEGVLRKEVTAAPGSTLVLQHLEGASWEFVTISRYASWTAFGDSLQKERGQAVMSPISAGLGDHMAEHHDTLAERVVVRTAPPREE